MLQKLFRANDYGEDRGNVAFTDTLDKQHYLVLPDAAGQLNEAIVSISTTFKADGYKRS